MGKANHTGTLGADQSEAATPHGANRCTLGISFFSCDTIFATDGSCSTAFWESFLLLPFNQNQMDV